MVCTTLESDYQYWDSVYSASVLAVVDMSSSTGLTVLFLLKSCCLVEVSVTKIENERLKRVSRMPFIGRSPWKIDYGQDRCMVDSLLRL